MGLTNRAISSMVERLPYKQDVTGSSPVLPISSRKLDYDLILKLESPSKGSTRYFLLCLTLDHQKGLCLIPSTLV